MLAFKRKIILISLKDAVLILTESIKLYSENNLINKVFVFKKKFTTCDKNLLFFAQCNLIVFLLKTGVLVM